MLELYTYSLPFKHTFITGAGSFKYREGLLIRYYDQHLDIVSEVAPLPGFSTETLKEAKEDLIIKIPAANQFLSSTFTPESLSKWLKSQHSLPSVEFGLSSLGLSILSARHHTPIHELMQVTPSASASVKMNAVIGSLNESAFLSAAEDHILSGFNILKCKVTSSPEHLPESIRKIAARHPSVSFRLDANRSWKLENLAELSAQFTGLPVEYIEEPCRITSVDELNTVISRCTLPVAADESLTELGLLNVIEHAENNPYLIIKPMLLGNLTELFATIGPHFHLDNKVIVTTALESAVGTRTVAAVAALAGSKSSAHGLNTGSLFHRNLASENLISNGTFRFNDDFKCWFSFDEIDQSLITPAQ